MFQMLKIFISTEPLSDVRVKEPAQATPYAVAEALGLGNRCFRHRFSSEVEHNVFGHDLAIRTSHHDGADRCRD
jgi:hypothetical protein